MHTRVAELLIDIEGELRKLGLWSQIPPTEKALASEQAFCVDALTLSQWLQFIFLPTLYGLIENRQDLPRRCGVAPMAEEDFRNSEMATDALIAALHQIDITLSGEGVES